MRYACGLAHTCTCRDVSTHEWVRLTPIESPPQKLSLLQAMRPAQFLELRGCFGAEDMQLPAPRTLSSEAWTRSGQAASPSQQRECGWLKLGCDPEERRQSVQGPLVPCGSSLPTRTCTSSCRPFLFPYPVPIDPSRQHPFTVQMGKLRPREDRAAQATQQVSSRIRTEIQPGFYSLSPLPAISASPSSSHCRRRSKPSRPSR